jgi:hypothetical protein
VRNLRWMYGYRGHQWQKSSGPGLHTPQCLQAGVLLDPEFLHPVLRLDCPVTPKGETSPRRATEGEVDLLVITV